MSETTRRLQAFGTRLAEDGYPTALIEQAVARMDAMENVIVEQQAENERLEAQIKVWKTTPIGRLESVEAENEQLRAVVDAAKEVIQDEQVYESGTTYTLMLLEKALAALD